MKICVVFNPSARGEKARGLRQFLGELEGGCHLKPTTGPGAARKLATDAVQQGYQVVVAAGGDGTLNEVLNGIADHPQGLSQAALAVLPLGTVNVFAKEYLIPASLAEAWQVIRRGQTRLIDLPLVEFTTPAGRQTRAFGQMAGAGLDARAIELVNWEMKKKIGQMAYVLAGFHALAGPKPAVTASHAGGTATGELVLIGNGRFYGGPVPIFHKADPADGLLDVCVFPRAGIQLISRYAWAFLTGKLFYPPGTIYFQTREVKITSSKLVSAQLEGELAGHLPMRVTIRPEALRVIVP